MPRRWENKLGPLPPSLRPYEDDKFFVIHCRYNHLFVAEQYQAPHRWKNRFQGLYILNYFVSILYSLTNSSMYSKKNLQGPSELSTVRAKLERSSQPCPQIGPRGGQQRTDRVTWSLGPNYFIGEILIATSVGKSISGFIYKPLRECSLFIHSSMDLADNLCSKGKTGTK